MKRRYLQGLCLALICMATLSARAADPRAGLLQAWEDLQANSAEVEVFRKIADGKYWIGFSNLPYEGELVVLAYDTEEMDFGGFESIPYSLTGYVEVDLVDAAAEETAKYARSLGKWQQSNTLFFNRETQTWDSYKAYRSKLQRQTEDLAPGSGLLMLFGYGQYILLGLILYFLYVAASNDRRVKKSIALQEQALANVEASKRLMREGLSLQRESNQLLQQVLREIQGQRKDRAE